MLLSSAGDDMVVERPGNGYGKALAVSIERLLLPLPPDNDDPPHLRNATSGTASHSLAGSEAPALQIG